MDQKKEIVAMNTFSRGLVGLVVLSFFVGTSFAQGIEGTCRELITTGLREYSINTESSSYLNSVFSRYCEKSGTTKATSIGAGIDLVVKAIPVGLTGSFSSNEEAMRNFCKNYTSHTEAASSKLQYEEKIVARAYESFDQCVQIAMSGVIVKHKVRDLNNVDFFIAPGFSRPVTLRGIKTTPNMTCEGQDPTKANNPVIKLGMSANIVLTGDRTLNVACTRSGARRDTGETIFDESTVTLLTNIAPSGNYSAYMPSDTKLSQDQARQLARDVAALKTENQALKVLVHREMAAFSTGIENLGSLNGHHGSYVEKTIAFVDRNGQAIQFTSPPRVVVSVDEGALIDHKGLNWVVNVLKVSGSNFQIRARATQRNRDGNLGWIGDLRVHWIAYTPPETASSTMSP